LLWLKIVLDEHKVKCEEPMTFLCDNKSVSSFPPKQTLHQRKIRWWPYDCFLHPIRNSASILFTKFLP